MENKDSLKKIIHSIFKFNVLFIGVILVLILFSLFTQKGVAPVTSPDPTHGLREQDTQESTIAQGTEVTSKESFVHPPAEGKFIAGAITNFTASYDKVRRKFIIHANVDKLFMFEANVQYKVYDSKGVLITKGATTAYGEDAQSVNDVSLPADIELKIPDTIKDGEILVFRILADNPSGLPEYDYYWGTTLKVQ